MTLVHKNKKFRKGDVVLFKFDGELGKGPIEAVHNPPNSSFAVWVIKKNESSFYYLSDYSMICLLRNAS